MEDTHFALSVALILSYKRSTHEKKKRELSPMENRNNKKTKIKRKIEGWNRGLKDETEEKS